MNELKPFAILDALNRFKQEISEEFIVGGSLALYQQGFDCCPHDIDLELKTSDQNLIKKLNLLNATYINQKDSCRYPQIENHFRFMFYGVMFDVWVVNEFDYNKFLYKDYIRYADAVSVLKKKAALGRMKDFKDIVGFAQQILSTLK